MLRAEWMDADYWWWAVYDMQEDEVTIDSSIEYDIRFLIGGDASKEQRHGKCCKSIFGN